MSDTEITGEHTSEWCVYQLECEWRQYSQKRYKGWQYAASKAAKRVYVGSTNDLERRMKEHKNQRHGQNPDADFPGSEFTSYFPPKEIIGIHFCESEQEARRKEEKIADDLDTFSGWFVWQN